MADFERTLACLSQLTIFDSKHVTWTNLILPRFQFLYKLRKSFKTRGKRRHFTDIRNGRKHIIKIGECRWRFIKIRIYKEWCIIKTRNMRHCDRHYFILKHYELHVTFNKKIVSCRRHFIRLEHLKIIGNGLCETKYK